MTHQYRKAEDPDEAGEQKEQDRGKQRRREALEDGTKDEALKKRRRAMKKEIRSYYRIAMEKIEELRFHDEMNRMIGELYNAAAGFITGNEDLDDLNDRLLSKALERLEERMAA